MTHVALGCSDLQPFSVGDWKHSRHSFQLSTSKNGFRHSLTFCDTYAVPLMPAMTSNLKDFRLIFLLFGLISVCPAQNEGITDAVKNIFLTKRINSTESEFILKSARESYLMLKDVEKGSDYGGKLNFVKNYANFLLKLLEEIKGRDFDIHQLFSKENSFLKGYTPDRISGEFNITELKIKIEDLQFAAERHLIVHYNSSEECYNVTEVLGLNETSFDAFLKEKLRTDYSEVGYFFLEVFATLIGLSWGLISTVLYYGETGIENLTEMNLH